MEISQLQPQEVFRFFQEISRIPRPSHREKQISDYLVRFARQRGLTCVQDDLYNVVMIKEASKGYEDQPPIILQGHMDMVCEQEKDCGKDMEREGLDLATDGREVWAEGTTLGGDDGIAVAYALAILDRDDIPHPRLEFVCTVCEEVGMEGATALDVSCLQGRRLLNLDSEEEGIFLAGCAGGCTARIQIPVPQTALQGVEMELSIQGLLGGHSGTEIHRERGNANLLMLEWLRRIYEKQSFSCVSLEGGTKDNAIPRSCVCHIAAPTEEAQRLEDLARQTGAEMEAAWRQREPGIRLEVQTCQGESRGVDAERTGRLLEEISRFPNGVIAMCREPEGLVETSLNLGILQMQDGEVRLRYSVRSCVERQLTLLTERLSALAEEAGGVICISGKYPAWEYQSSSPFREKLTEIYREMYHKRPEIQVIHAGLECGILASKIPGLECVSMGPDIHDIHTPGERIDVASVQRTYEFLLEVLAQKEAEKEGSTP